MDDNPRSLAGEVGGLDELIIEAISLLPTVTNALATVDSAGWAAIESTILSRLEETKNQAIMAPTMERLAECRGMIRAFNTFLAIPRSLRSQQAQLHELAAEYEVAADDEEG